MEPDTKDNLTDLAEALPEIETSDDADQSSDGQVTDDDGNIITLDP